MILSREHLEATSILTLGATGTLDGQPFTLVGRRCFSGRRGNLWNEWSLDGIPSCFLSEFAGSFTLYREGPLLDPSDEPTVGERLPWLVVERGTASRLAEWGEVDDAPATYDFLDLLSLHTLRRASVADGRTFIGDSVDPTVLGLLMRRTPPRLVPVPNISPPSGLEMWLDVGDCGTLDGVEYTVLGVIARSRDEDRWEEYCMYSAGVGLRWLVVSDGHWSYVAPASGEPVHFVAAPTYPKVTWATGELPWAAQ